MSLSLSPEELDDEDDEEDEEDEDDEEFAASLSYREEAALSDTSDGRLVVNSLLLTEPSPLLSSLLNSACRLDEPPLTEEMLMTILLMARTIGVMAARRGTARPCIPGGLNHRHPFS